ncbi:MAG: hypothetical protein Q4E47_03150 [Candidatus Saccharibacteria bacterium]|nr:hypothetical protein [Candidatus Saccharibacteria bacterium]
MDTRVISATLNLRSLENAASFSPAQTGSLYHPSSAVSTAKSSEEAEENNSYYTGSGKSPAPKKPKGFFRNAKKTGPTAIVIGVVFAAVFAIFGSASFLGSQMETLLTRATDTVFGSYSENSLRITKELLAGERGSFPKYFENRLKKEGVEVTGSGPYTLNYDGYSITADNFEEYYKNDIQFREAYTKAKRGRTANFFDIPASLAFAKISLSRNLFANYRQTGDAKSDDASYRKLESSVFEDGTATRLNTVTEKEVTDENGNPITDENGNTVTEKAPSGEDINSSGTSGDSPKVKAQNYLLDISARVSEAGGIACAALKVGNLISTAIAVNQIYQMIHYFGSGEENVSKTLSGHGDAAAMNYLFNDMAETKTTTYIDAETGEEKEITGAMLEAEGFATSLAGERANTKKTKNYSIESAFITTGFAIGLTAANNKLCGGVRVAGAVISLISFAVSGALINSVVTLAKTVIVNAALATTISTMLSALIPRIATTLFTNRFEQLEGIPAGEAYVEGVDLLNKKVARQSNGQLLATEEIATAYNVYTIAAAANEAELDREQRSPFDLSSPNTFLGSLVGKMAVLAGSSNILSSLKSVGSLIGSATSSITNHFLASASASNSMKDSATILAIFENTKLNVDTSLSGTEFQSIFSDTDTCKNLSSIGAACDMYSAEITASDPKVIGKNLNKAKYEEVVEENTEKDEDGFRKVKDHSLLAKKVKYCDGRDSPFGVLDANILNDFETTLGVFDYFPVISDVVDIVNAVETASDEAINWATGQYCVMSEADNPYYEDLIYLQAFEEDQRIASQLKLDEVTDEEGNDRNSIVAFTVEYNEKNPLDTSNPAAILAHYTGSTLEDAELALSLIEYCAFLENYNPPEFTPLSPEYTLSYASIEDSESTLSNFIYLYSDVHNPIIYDDLRSKSYAV